MEKSENHENIEKLGVRHVQVCSIWIQNGPKSWKNKKIMNKLKNWVFNTGVCWTRGRVNNQGQLLLRPQNNSTHIASCWAHQVGHRFDTPVL